VKILWKKKLLKRCTHDGKFPKTILNIKKKLLGEFHVNLLQKVMIFKKKCKNEPIGLNSVFIMKKLTILIFPKKIELN